MEVDVDDRLTINKSYAERYEKKKRTEELSKREAWTTDCGKGFCFYLQRLVY